VLFLWRFVAVAVALFGAGFLYLSEQVRPGQLDRFRLGHFLLLAITFSLFFAIFTVLEFHGHLGTVPAMIVSAIFSLPLLVLHVAAFLGLWFALTRVLPLAVFSLGLVINGVYGGPAQDYIFTGAAVVIIAYLTATFPRWAAGRARHRKESDQAYAADRAALTDLITYELGRRMADFKAADARAERRIQSLATSEGPDRLRLDLARQPVSRLVATYEDLQKRLGLLPTQRDWLQADALPKLRAEAQALLEQLNTTLPTLVGESGPAASGPTAPAEHHCAACGHAVAPAPFCSNCGARQAVELACGRCGAKTTVPMHLLPAGTPAAGMFCAHCGAVMGATA
jgi:hypothetical protein